MTEPVDSDHPELLPEADWAAVVAEAEALNDEVTDLPADNDPLDDPDAKEDDSDPLV